MGVITDKTGLEIVGKIGNLNVDTSGLVKDTTAQAIKGSLDNLINAVKPDASDIPYNSSLSVKDKIDEVDEARYQIKSYNSSIPVDNMYGNNYSGVYWMTRSNWSGMPSGSYGYLEIVGNLQKFYPYASGGRADVYIRMHSNATWNEWKRVSSLSDASISRQSGVSSNVPIPQITRRGNEVIVHFAHQFPAGTYQQLYEVTPTPASEQHAIVALGNNIIIVHLSTSGRIRFNSQQTISATSYLIGQLVYLTDD